MALTARCPMTEPRYVILRSQGAEITTVGAGGGTVPACYRRAMTDNDVMISIPGSLCERLGLAAGVTGTDAVSRFVTYLLEQLSEAELEAVRQRLAAAGNPQAQDETAADPAGGDGYSEAERDEVEARLASLGYIE
jgi:hypothetical protein